MIEQIGRGIVRAVDVSLEDDPIYFGALVFLRGDSSQTAAIAEQRLGNLSYETEQHSEFGAGCFRQCWPLLWIPKSPAWNDRQRRSGSFVLDC